MNAPDVPVPLWRQLQAAARVVELVRNGTSGTAAIEGTAAALRAGVQALAFAAWRDMGRAQALRTLLAAKQPPAPADALLCLALTLMWRTVDAPYDAFTLVNQVVEAAKRNPATKAQANFLNACLRRFLREREALVAATDADPVALWNHPRWWIERLRRERPQDWQSILTAANAHAPMTLRVNTRKTGIADYLLKLERAGLAARSGGASVVYLEQPVPVRLLPGFEIGLVSVQDAAAQLAAPLLLAGLPATAGLRVLDACAAPGGKTGHLLEISDCAVSALEIDPRRSERIAENLQRMQLKAQLLVADAAKPQDWWDGEPFDAILLDAPCTASGIVRRHPDVRWLRREADIEQLAALQRRMLQTLWALLRPGGRLLYCTCSIFVAEGDGQMQTFLAHNTDAALLPSPGHLMPRNDLKTAGVLDNPLCDHDGFYYALLQKHLA
ncbi:MAG: 16S rRNA (cytosine(967)-C(5))-methyltransferase RsmB [Burkholderiales bacterium]